MRRGSCHPIRRIVPTLFLFGGMILIDTNPLRGAHVCLETGARPWPPFGGLERTTPVTYGHSSLDAEGFRLPWAGVVTSRTNRAVSGSPPAERAFDASAVAGVTPSDSLALVALFTATNGTGWSNKTNWLVGQVKDWYGVTLSGNRVFALDLGSNNLSGSIPADVGNLTALSSLNLQKNKLTGSIPSQLGSLPALVWLNLAENQLTGSIPASLGTLPSLQQLYLQQNQLSGSIPASLGNVSGLVILILHTNSLSGTIPAEIGKLNGLQWLSLDGNQLSGEIPASLGNLTQLQILYLGDNLLSGPIPWQLGNLSSLKAFYLGENQLSGTLPPELGTLTNLEAFDVSNNQLSGFIPPELGNLTMLKALYLAGNQFSGRIPPALGDLTSLQWFSVASNQLGGSVPLPVAIAGALAQQQLGCDFTKNLPSLCIPDTPDYRAIGADPICGLPLSTSCSAGIDLSIRFLLEGPYSGGAMRTALRTAGLIPLAQPYDTSPWNYAGAETVTTIPADVVDWVLISLRTGTASSSEVARRAGFLKADGSVIDLDGGPLHLELETSGPLYIVVDHRNHVAVMSAHPVTLSAGSASYDFSTSASQAYGQNAMAPMTGAVYGLFSGDANGVNGVTASDNAVWVQQNGTDGYKAGDFNLNGQITAADAALWTKNNGKGASVPG